MSEQRAMHDQKEALYRTVSTAMTPLPGLAKLLDWCDSNKIATIVVTNAPRLDAHHTLKVRVAYGVTASYACFRSSVCSRRPLHEFAACT